MRLPVQRDSGRLLAIGGGELQSSVSRHFRWRSAAYGLCDADMSRQVGARAFFCMCWEVALSPRRARTARECAQFGGWRGSNGTRTRRTHPQLVPARHDGGWWVRGGITCWRCGFERAQRNQV